MDNSPVDDKNQPSGTIQPPTYETVPVSEIPQPVQPEEVSPNVQTPEEVAGSVPPAYPTDMPPVYEESKNTFMIAAVVIAFFLAILFGFYWFFLKDRLAGLSTPTSKEAVTLTYWGLWEEKEIMDPLIAAYKQKNPNVTINYEVQAPVDYREKLIARSKAGNGPDLYRFHNTWLPEIQEVITSVPGEIMSTDEFEQTFYPIHQRDLKIGEAYYGIPLYIDGLVLIYNNQLLQQAGIVSPPSVWVGDQNDVLTVASNLTVRNSDGTILTSGIALGTANNVEHFSESYAMLLALNGGNIQALQDPEATEALQLYRKFGEDNLWNETMPNSVSAFIEGKVAMLIAPSWQILAIKAQNPQLDVKVAPVPKGLNDTRISVASYWVEGVNKFSKNQLESWKFLKFLSEKEQMTKMYEAQSKVRLFGSAYSRKDLADTLKQNEYLKPVIDQAETDAYISAPVVSRTFDNGLNDEINQYLRNAINSTVQGVDYSTALNTAAQGISKAFEKFKIE
ncbi:MAG: ABC transporter substrate-binding protein [Weeksellaceae bacterium]